MLHRLGRFPGKASGESREGWSFGESLWKMAPVVTG